MTECGDDGCKRKIVWLMVIQSGLLLHISNETLTTSGDIRADRRWNRKEKKISL